jgi:hypothetical protein
MTMEFSINNIIQILQLSIVPTVLISGVGLLILTLNNRMAHLLDRIRKLIEDYRVSDDVMLKTQIDLLYRRGKILRKSVFCLVTSIFIDVLVILSVFSIKLFALNGGELIVVLFILSMISFVLGLCYFIYDVNLNLRALKVEMKDI